MGNIEKTPNWMEYPPLLQLYQQVQASESGLEPDPEFLSDPKLGRYEEYQLKHLEIPQNIKDLLTQVGLPDQFRPFRLPSDEKSGKLAYIGTMFWLSCLRNETINRKKYLVVAESREIGNTCIVSQFGKPDEKWIWNKTESVSFDVVELKTGFVWIWHHDSFGDEFTFVNSSLEQFLLSMAYWESFYAGFSKKIQDYLKKNKDKSEWQYVDRNRRKLYAPFLDCMKALDPPALRKRMSWWKRMTDISLI